MKPELSFARIGFLNMLAYRARYYVGVLTYLFNVAVYYFIWRAVFSHSPRFACSLYSAASVASSAARVSGIPAAKGRRSAGARMG